MLDSPFQSTRRSSDFYRTWALHLSTPQLGETWHTGCPCIPIPNLNIFWRYGVVSYIEEWPEIGGCQWPSLWIFCDKQTCKMHCLHQQPFIPLQSFCLAIFRSLALQLGLLFFELFCFQSSFAQFWPPTVFSHQTGTP